jgi:hypothetical protein
VKGASGWLCGLCRGDSRSINHGSCIDLSLQTSPTLEAEGVVEIGFDTIATASSFEERATLRTVGAKEFYAHWSARRNTCRACRIADRLKASKRCKANFVVSALTRSTSSGLKRFSGMR